MICGFWGLGVRPHPNPPPEGEGIIGRRGSLALGGCWGLFVEDGFYAEVGALAVGGVA